MTNPFVRTLLAIGALVLILLPLYLLTQAPATAPCWQPDIPSRCFLAIFVIGFPGAGLATFALLALEHREGA